METYAKPVTKRTNTVGLYKDGYLQRPDSCYVDTYNHNNMHAYYTHRAIVIMIKSFSEFFVYYFVCMCVMYMHMGRSVCVPFVICRGQLTGAVFSFHYVNPKDQIQQKLNDPFLWTFCLDFYKNLFSCIGASKKSFPCYTSLLDTVFQEFQRNLKEIRLTDV